METLTIDRGRWLTGTAKKILGGSALYDSKSTLQCCLGIYCEDNLGILKEELRGRAMPEDISSLETRRRLPEWLKSSSAYSPAEQLADANDNEDRHPIRREARIKKLFKAQDIDVVFTGRYADATAKARKAMKG